MNLCITHLSRVKCLRSVFVRSHVLAHSAFSLLLTCLLIEMRGQNTSSAKSMGRILRLLFYQTKALLDNLCGAIVLITRVPCVKAALPQNRKEQNCRCFNIFFLWGNFLSDLYENCFFAKCTHPLLDLLLAPDISFCVPSPHSSLRSCWLRNSSRRLN